MRYLILFVFVALIFTACKDDEVTIFPVEDPSGISWCKYEIKEMLSTDSTARLQTGKIICLVCKNPNKNCPDYTKFKYGAYEMQVKRVAKPCSSCPNNNFFDVGGPIQ